MSGSSPVILDPWSRLRRHTLARIALGRAGASLPTAEWLRFSLDHAAARDAVRSQLNLDELEEALRPLEMPMLRLESAAPDLLTYLQRPDLGRRLSEASREHLAAHRAQEQAVDAALILAGGLSALAVQRHGPALLRVLVPKLREAGLTLGPIVLVRHGRVAIQDEIGFLLKAQTALILLGERPGLGSPDSLGAYFVFGPKPGNTDANRNCISNVRPQGLGYRAAAQTACYLISEGLRRRISGISLKDDRAPVLPGGESK